MSLSISTNVNIKILQTLEHRIDRDGGGVEMRGVNSLITLYNVYKCVVITKRKS